MFFSNIHWPQLTAPFYSILFETSICQFNSSTCSPLMPDEVREHLTRDRRTFLHPESLQTVQIPCSMLVLLLFSSPHSFSTGFRSEDWKDHSRSLAREFLVYIVVELLSHPFTNLCGHYRKHVSYATWPFLIHLSMSLSTPLCLCWIRSRYRWL